MGKDGVEEENNSGWVRQCSPGGLLVLKLRVTRLFPPCDDLLCFFPWAGAPQGYRNRIGRTVLHGGENGVELRVRTFGIILFASLGPSSSVILRLSTH